MLASTGCPVACANLGGSTTGGTASGTVVHFDFTSSSPAGWTNSANSQTNRAFSHKMGGHTPSSRTGPPSSTHFPYYYAETSSRGKPYKNFLLTYDGRDCPQGIASVDFEYNMYGSSMGTLSLWGGNGNGSGVALGFSKSGDQGMAWHSTSVQVNNVGFAFAYTSGTSWKGDAAFGEVTVTCN